jgi:hypothetical protein
MNIVKLLRPFKTQFNNIISANTVRGAKRKAEKKQDGILSEHILNVYKNKDDIAILPDEYYPPWVKTLSEEPFLLEESCINSLWGITYAHPSHQSTIYKKARRNIQFKYKNQLRYAKAEWELKWEKQPENTEYSLDVEWGDLPEQLEKLEKDADAATGGSQQNGGGGGGAPKEEAK